jgi:hypothetical protein
MTNDLDFVRDLLFRTEREHGFSSTDPRIVYHVGLMHKAGLVRAIVTPKKWKKRFTLAIVKGLNAAGREFLRAAKDESLWTQAKQDFIRPGLFFSLRLLTDYLKQKEKRVIIPMSEFAESEG